MYFTARPAAGTLSEATLPGGYGIRVDSHAYAGLQIPPYYDSLLAKVVAHGSTRHEAIVRMECALRETHIAGVNTTVDLCLAVMRDEGFRAGGVPIDYLPNFAAAVAATGS